jgi:hypothetical protein
MAYSPIQVHSRFEGTCYLHLHTPRISQASKQQEETVDVSKLVRTARCYIPENVFLTVTTVRTSNQRDLYCTTHEGTTNFFIFLKRGPPWQIFQNADLDKTRPNIFDLVNI